MAGPLLSIPHLIIFAGGAITGAVAQRKLDEKALLDRVDERTKRKANEEIRKAEERMRKREERRKNRHLDEETS